MKRYGFAEEVMTTTSSITTTTTVRRHMNHRQWSGEDKEGKDNGNDKDKGKAHGHDAGKGKDKDSGKAKTWSSAGIGKGNDCGRHNAEQDWEECWDPLEEEESQRRQLVRQFLKQLKRVKETVPQPVVKQPLQSKEDKEQLEAYATDRGWTRVPTVYQGTQLTFWFHSVTQQSAWCLREIYPDFCPVRV
jgi:hypothetical protein